MVRPTRFFVLASRIISKCSDSCWAQIRCSLHFSHAPLSEATVKSYVPRKSILDGLRKAYLRDIDNYLLVAGPHGAGKTTATQLACSSQVRTSL